ncbi:MAG: hypothetical protein BroJett040_02640 [Oligoflexia bacterium]|nr:MAG: hypothetical protein BroJett040_02640 [Oligoflexia bacterium]
MISEQKFTRTTTGKALELNQNPAIYGAFAEIGAGQEVARFFFQAGQASQTIAKTMSAYDMIYSDEIYGKEASGRYVCESRLIKMLDKEYSLLQKRLDKSRGDKTTFFAFADTVTTGDMAKRHCHGWIGVRFQTKPKGQPNDIIMHVQMMDKYRLQQQETLGVVGVNLVYTAFHHIQNHERIIPALVDNIKEGQVIIDMIRFTGPDVAHINNHLMNLELVRRHLAEAVVFTPDQNIITVADAVYGKPLIVERGSFRPVTNAHLDLLQKGIQQFHLSFPKEKDPLILFEMTMNALQVQGKFDERDFLNRVRALTSLGYPVMVSSHFRFFTLKRYLRQYTKEPIGLIIGAKLLERIFDEKHYQDLEGGIIEALSKLFDGKTLLYVYPTKSADSCLTARSFHPDPKLKHIFRHYQELDSMVDLASCEQVDEFVHSDRILDMIENGNFEWERLVPASVRDLIQKEKLFQR